MKQKTLLLTRAALLCAIIVVSTLWLKFSIPGTDVMVTTQVFFVLLCGFLLPPQYCLLCLGTYLLLGLIGLPVFSATVGPAVLSTPSFGYLLAFPFAAAGVSCLQKKWSAKKFGPLWASFCGVAISYVIALPYIAILKAVYLQTPISLVTLLSAYCLAFLPLDIVKAFLAALLGTRLQKALKIGQD